jgi:hypothetical protein
VCHVFALLSWVALYHLQKQSSWLGTVIFRNVYYGDGKYVATIISLVIGIKY